MWLRFFSGSEIAACSFFERGLSSGRGGQGASTCVAAIVGRGLHCRQLTQKFGSIHDSTHRISTIFDTVPETDSVRCVVPTYRGREQFAEYVCRHKLKDLCFVLPMSEDQAIRDFIDLIRYEQVNIRFIPEVRGAALFDAEMRSLDGTTATNLIDPPLSSRALVVKYVFDRVFAFVVLIALWPLFLMIAGAVKFSSPGPIFFKQRRKGANGKIFNIYKFRSMRAHVSTVGLVEQATRNDPRITCVGAFLRRTSLDELPQFFNVLRGDMSVVGPRPHAIEHDAFYENIVDGYIHRYCVKPGITGWAQINGYRGETDRVEKMQIRVEHDLYYLSNWSFWLDMRILIATMFMGLVGRNAY